MLGIGQHGNPFLRRINGKCKDAGRRRPALNVIDDTARSNAQTALNNAEYNRQSLIGKYGGQNIATILAGEIGSGSVYDALHKRAANGNFAGLRVGDYIDVPLVSASGVAAQQSVRFLLAHFDPYYRCGDSSKGHHIAFVASAPIAVAKTVTGVANDSFLMWNTTNTNQGTADQKCPYPNSNLKAWETAFEACLPEGLTKYLLTQRVLLEERYSASGALNDSNSWELAGYRQGVLAVRDGGVRLPSVGHQGLQRRL